MPSTEPAPVDPRAEVVERDGHHVIVGCQCCSCGYPMQIAVHQCPACGGEVESTAFGPEGTVWSATVLRIPMPGRRTPYVVSWVDLDRGPRVIAHLDGVDEAPPVGTRVRLTAAQNRDIHAEVMT